MSDLLLHEWCWSQWEFQIKFGNKIHSSTEKLFYTTNKCSLVIFSVWINLNVTLVKVQHHRVLAKVEVIYVVVFSIYPSLRKTDRTSLRSRTSHAAESFSTEKRNRSSSSLPWSSSSSSPELAHTQTHTCYYYYMLMCLCVKIVVFTTWGSRVRSPIGRLGQVGWDLWKKQ